MIRNEATQGVLDLDLEIDAYEADASLDHEVATALRKVADDVADEWLDSDGGFIDQSVYELSVMYQAAERLER
jgi:hypothetical protein